MSACLCSAVEGKEPYILLLQLQRLEMPCRHSTLSIQHSDGNFSNEYIALTKSFYLKF
jgi:tRNA1(Val) A37 N6-methylase TrmN6